MKTAKVSLDTVDKIKTFVNLAMAVAPDIDLSSDNTRYIVDAKSIMGVFSLNTARPLNVTIHSEDDAVCDEILESMKDFIVTA